MPQFIHRANIDHYLEVLSDLNVASDERATVAKLLVAEEDKLSRYQEQLEFAESRAARGRELLDKARSRLNSDNLREHYEAVRLVSNLQSIQHLLNFICHQLRTIVNSGP